MRRLVIVRPEPGASATARAAEAIGLEAVKLPLFKVQPVGWVVPDAAEFDALLLTSANALRHGGPALEGLLGMQAHCVGEATAAAAREAGFRVETVGAAGVDWLLSRLPSDLRLLHLCGEHRREPPGVQSIVAVPVYRSLELPVPQAIGEAEGAVVCVHSPRAASALARALNGSGLARDSIALAAISEAAAQAAGSGWEAVEAADSPTEARLLAIAARLCNNRR